jgi:hypothetical protein
MWCLCLRNPYSSSADSSLPFLFPPSFPFPSTKARANWSSLIRKQRPQTAKATSGRKQASKQHSLQNSQSICKTTEQALK